MKKIVFTGGGSAGHVMPNVALMEQLKEKYELFYIGTDGIEKGLIAPLKIPYGQIECPKFIRGFAWKNFTIPFAFHRAVEKSKEILLTIQPDIIFSKGGYVALPVVFAAKKLKIPCLTHESDLSLGLANRLMGSKCEYLLTAFPETAESVMNGRYVGAPLRSSIFGMDKSMARAKYGFSALNKPVLLVLGGGSGSKTVNDFVRKNLFQLCRKYYILHLCGKGNCVESNVAGYAQREFETDMGAAYACADGVIARSGANTVFEVLSLKKPTLFIPLQNARSRGDQVKNAEYFKKQGLCHVLYEKELEKLPTAIDGMMQDVSLQQRLKTCDVTCGNGKIIECIKEIIER
ncbi:MAG: UDP-N-acetylglucosamine--N-acetylmuramyl-(pentapeptide) pyrophosphoryl-undecaprenol N-acetylglucosamine transferase [Clostridia bacterium]|nr:UDP-N-acetylglucosamine--N-acetylmuramyl-(pentapeptide) pyrophosphoryl-undecaprenol N-acetylglucosamine transferase [Clostridia bacterium]